jgi:hypothetical protein
MLTVFILSSTYAPAFASSNVTVTAGAQKVHAQYSLSVIQNVTALPNVSGTVDANSGSNASATFTQAMRTIEPSATPSNLQIDFASKGRNLTLTCSMDVEGVSQVNGDILTVNMTWLSFNVSSDVRAQNLSLNTIGKTYFRSVVAYYANASSFIGRPNATITGVTFFVNGTSVGSPAAENYAGNFTTLNFGSISTDISQWNRTYTLTNNTTTWRYFPSELLNFDMRISRKANVTTDYTAKYGYNVTLSVPGVGRTKGDALVIDVGSGQTEWVMVAIVILLVFSAICVQLLLRGRRKRTVKFQRR